MNRVDEAPQIGPPSLVQVLQPARDEPSGIDDDRPPGDVVPVQDADDLAVVQLRAQGVSGVVRRTLGRAADTEQVGLIALMAPPAQDRAVPPAHVITGRSWNHAPVPQHCDVPFERVLGAGARGDDHCRRGVLAVDTWHPPAAQVQPERRTSGVREFGELVVARRHRQPDGQPLPVGLPRQRERQQARVGDEVAAAMVEVSVRAHLGRLVRVAKLPRVGVRLGTQHVSKTDRGTHRIVTGPGAAVVIEVLGQGEVLGETRILDHVEEADAVDPALPGQGAAEHQMVAVDVHDVPLRPLRRLLGPCDPLRRSGADHVLQPRRPAPIGTVGRVRTTSDQQFLCPSREFHPDPVRGRDDTEAIPAYLDLTLARDVSGHAVGRAGSVPRPRRRRLRSRSCTRFSARRLVNTLQAHPLHSRRNIA